MQHFLQLLYFVLKFFIFNLAEWYYFISTQSTPLVVFFAGQLVGGLGHFRRENFDQKCSKRFDRKSPKNVDRKSSKNLFRNRAVRTRDLHSGPVFRRLRLDLDRILDLSGHHAGRSKPFRFKCKSGKAGTSSFALIPSERAATSKFFIWKLKNILKLKVMKNNHNVKNLYGSIKL